MEQSLIIPYDWQGLDFTPKWEDEETGQVQWGTRKYRIFVWGHDQHNDPVCWVVDDYMPHLYVRIEDEIGENRANEAELAPYVLEALNQNLKDYIKEKSNEPRHSHLKGLLRLDQIVLGYVPEDRLPMFYYKTEKHRVYKVFFQLEATMQLCYEYLDKRKISMPNGFKIAAKAYNNGSSDRIETEAKLLVERGLERCSWMFANARLKQHEGLTTLEKEYTVSYQDLMALPQEYALKLGFPKPSTISFDSETFSKVFTRFPKASRLSDEMYAAGFRHRVYSSLGCKNPKVTNYIFVIWDPDKYGKLRDYSKEYGDSVYVYCRDEQEFLMKLFEYIRILDPTFIIGYNQLGFDWDYVEQRCEIFGIKPPNLSRIRGWFKSQFIHKTWKKFSSAWPQYPGRIDVDMLYIARISMIKTTSFKLKDVAKALLPAGHTKVELPYKEQFRIYAAKDRDGMDRIMDYLHMDIKLPEELYDKLSMPVYLHTNASVMKVNILPLYTDGQSARCIGQLYEQVVEDGMYVNSRTIWKAGKYVGGLVFDQISGIYDNVLTFDWNSLYPSKMKVDNICYSSLIEEKVDGDKYTDDDCHVVEGDVPIVDKKTKEVISMDHHKFRYIKKTTRMGLLPKIVIKLNKLRSEYKKPMEAAYAKAKELKKELEALRAKHATEKTDDETEQATRKARITQLLEEIRHWQGEGDIWNVKQNAVKVSANSMYGFMGMKTGKYSFIEGGMSTTIGGRDALRKTLDIIVTHYGAKLVYGDTDSVMVQFPESVINASNYKAKSKEIAAYISSQFPEGMVIVPENFFLRFFTITKKRYAAIKINPEKPDKFPTEKEILDGNLLYVKGLISVRGNSCGIVYENFNPFLMKMLMGVPVSNLFDHLHHMALKIMRREYPLEDYILRQKLGAEYKNKSSEMAVFSDRLKQQGRAHKPGEELEFVYTKTNIDCLKGYKMQTPDLFFENGNVLDTMYYLTNKIAKPIEQLLTCVYDDSVLKPKEKKTIRPRKPTSVQKVTKHWHLELYIRKLIAGIHANWEMVQNEVKLIREIAEQRGIINYVTDETRTAALMKQKYGVDWVPQENPEAMRAAEKKEPIHRHQIWKMVDGVGA